MLHIYSTGMALTHITVCLSYRKRPSSGSASSAYFELSVLKYAKVSGILAFPGKIYIFHHASAASLIASEIV